MKNENTPTEGQNSDKREAESALRDAACYTIFYDMSSGGSEKESFTKLAVKLPESEAVEWFEKTFGRDPHNVTCQCCGADYAVSRAEPCSGLRDPETAPRDGSRILAHVGWPYLVPAVWCDWSERWSVVTHECSLKGEMWERWWETDTEQPDDLKGWLPWPAIPQNSVFSNRAATTQSDGL